MPINYNHKMIIIIINLIQSQLEFKCDCDTKTVWIDQTYKTTNMSKIKYEFGMHIYTKYL